MPRMTKKQKEAEAAEEAARLEAEQVEHERIAKHQRQLRIWTMLSILLVFGTFIAVRHGDYIVGKLKFSSEAKADAQSKKLALHEELGIDKPVLLCLDLTTKKDLVKIEVQKERQKHDDEYGIASCVRCCKDHAYCKYCKKPMEAKTYARHRRR